MKYTVEMTCEACANRVRKALLGKVEGVESLDIDVPSKTVVVNGNPKAEDVEAALTKTRLGFSSSE